MKLICTDRYDDRMDVMKNNYDENFRCVFCHCDIKPNDVYIYLYIGLRDNDFCVSCFEDRFKRCEKCRCFLQHHELEPINGLDVCINCR